MRIHSRGSPAFNAAVYSILMARNTDRFHDQEVPILIVLYRTDQCYGAEKHLNNFINIYTVL